MKVLVFTTLYPNNVWPHHCVFVKKRMVRFATLEGCSIKVIAPVPYYPPIQLGWRRHFSRVARQEVRDGTEVYHPRYLMTPKVGMTLHGFLMLLAALPTAKKIQRTYDFDLIDAHFVYPDGFAGVLLGRWLRKPVVVSARGSDINRYGMMSGIRPLLRYTLRNADAVISVSQALKDAMVELGAVAHKVSVVPNGVDVGEFHRVEREQARRALGLPAGSILLSVGSLVPVKGFDLLIRAFQVLLERSAGRDVTLFVVGEGPVRATLERTVAAAGLRGRIRFVGAVPHEQLAPWYSAADLFCLASSREGCPNVILEALACGTPVVATRVGGIPEILCSDRLGLLAERDPQGIAAAMAQALARPWDPQEIERHAGEYSWDRTARSVLAVFRSVLDSRCGQSLPVEPCVRPAHEWDRTAARKVRPG